jgi:hypothetical protein
MPVERQPISFKQKIGEKAIDFLLPGRYFTKELTREIRVCLEFFDDPYLVKGIGISIGRLGRRGRLGEAVDLTKREQRGYFWEVNGERHIVGQEVMTRKQKQALLQKLHGITIPYKQSEEWTKSDREIFGEKKKH